MNTYKISWTVTGDGDTCYGIKDVQDLMEETNCRIEGSRIVCNETGERVGFIKKED